MVQHLLLSVGGDQWQRNTDRTGTGPRNPFTGPDTKTVDFSVGKTFIFTERFRGELRGEFFNLLNTPQFDQPDGNINDAQRNPDGTISSQGKFGQITKLRFDSQREIQLTFRVSF